MTINELKDLIMKQAEDKGFGTKADEINVAEKFALIHTEVSEAYSAYRHKNYRGKNGFKEELGDVIQRVLHLCGIFKIDVEREILNKMEYNNKRVWEWSKLNETHK